MTQTTSPLRALLNVEASASVPKLSNAQMLDAPENSAIRDIWLMPPDNPALHAGRKVAVVATDGVEEIELTTVLHYFRSRGAQVDLIAPKKPSYPDFLGLQIPAVRETHIMTITFIATGGWIRFDRHLEDASAKDYDVLISLKTLGTGNGPSKPRLSAVTVRAARSAYEAGSGITAGSCLTARHTLDGSLRQTHTFHGWPLPQRS